MTVMIFHSYDKITFQTFHLFETIDMKIKYISMNLRTVEHFSSSVNMVRSVMCATNAYTDYKQSCKSIIVVLDR